MSQKSITSDPFTLTLPGATRPLYFRTETKFTPDVNGNPVAGTAETTLLYQLTPGGVDTQAATSTDGGKAGSWTLKTDGDGNNILGATAVQSLQTPNGVLNQQTQQSIISAATKEGITGGYQIPLADKLKNTAPDPGSPTPGSDSAPEPAKVDPNDISGLNAGIKSRDNSIIENYGDYRYPALMPDNMDKIKFIMYSYGVKESNKEFIGFNTKRKNTKINGSVTLGIQPRISDTNSVSWNDLSADAISLAAAGMSGDLISGGADEINSILSKIGKTFKAEKSNIQAYARTAFAGAAAGISGLTSRIGGVILNPNLELLFDSPQLRPFDFTFQLTPRDDGEAKQVKQIIRFFKQGMAVQRTETDLFLKAPNIFKITYMFGEQNDHPGLNRIKDCALVSCSVDYTPTGSYMTFPDGTMTAYNITLSFKELEPVYADEYEVGNDETVNNVRIGY